jgi:hypothetical protein
MQKTLIRSGSTFDNTIGHSRAVVVGDWPTALKKSQA